MNIVSNSEFVELTTGRTPKLKAIAKARYEQNPNGSVDEGGLDEITVACKHSGLSEDVNWLRTLKIWASNGKLTRMRKGQTTWEDHVEHVRRLCAQQTIPFGLNDLVIVKDDGKSGTIADYNVETKEYVVVLNPFQVANFPAKDLIRAKTPQ